MSLATVIALIVQAGFTVGTAYETDSHIYAFSKETAGPSTYGHPAAEAVYSKNSGYLRFPIPGGESMEIKVDNIEVALDVVADSRINYITVAA